MRSKTITVIVVLIGLVLGSFIGEVASQVSFLSWLNYGQSVGIPNFAIDLYSLQFNMGITLNCTISSILGLILALVDYYKIIK